MATVLPRFSCIYTNSWKDFCEIFGVDYPPSLDEQFSAQDWRRHLYFNASFFFYESPTKFGARFLEFAQSIKNSTRPGITRQSLDPWLDQVVLPIVIHSFFLGGWNTHTCPGMAGRKDQLSLS
jgi:hypothetical protein